MKKKDLIKKEITRRDFIQNSVKGVIGATMMPTMMPTILTSCSNWRGANDRVNIAHIGVGARGSEVIKGYFLPLKECRSLAVCDVFKNRREELANFISSYYKEKFSENINCKPYLKYEEILERDDIDAVHIATGDYWHLPIAIKAARAGKHIYCEKPLGLSLDNMKLLEKELKNNNVRWHYGTQQRSSTHIQRGIEMLRSGKIGEVNQLDVWAPPGDNEPVIEPKGEAVPEGFDYDRWLGPAPLKPYSKVRCTNLGAWHIYDYALGFIAGWGAHPLDVAVWGMKDKMTDIATFSGTGKFWPKESIYDTILTWDVNIEYKNGFKVHFMSTDAAVPVVTKYIDKPRGDGTTFFGSKGWISLSRSQGSSSIPELNSQLQVSMEQDAATGLLIRNDIDPHGLNFIKVIKGEIDEMGPIEDAILSDSISHMGNIAIRSGKNVVWDATTNTFPDAPELEAKYFHRNLRAPYGV